jgi:Carboxypeptidase regulatory-like domain
MLRKRRLIAAFSSVVLAVASIAMVFSAAVPAAASAVRPAAGNSVIEGVVSNLAGAPLAGVNVSVCEQSPLIACWAVVTGANGLYVVPGLPAGTYSVNSTAPPYLNGSNYPVTVAAGATQTANLVLLMPAPLPGGVVIPGTYGTPPMLFYGSAHRFSVMGQCAGGTATFTITENGVVIATGPMPEVPPGSGTYFGVIPSFAPYDHGYAEVTVTVHCPGGGTNVVPFSIYLDPSGTVVTPAGLPIGGATVTLLAATTAAGPFTPVPNGSTVMSPANRSNPVVTAPDGLYGWDVIPGFYEVQAQKAGCFAPTTPPLPVATSGVLQIAPAVTGVLLTLNCAGSPATSITSAGSATFTAGAGGTFQFTATGTPAPTWAEGSVLPAGVNFAAHAGGTATLTVTSGAAAGVTTLNLTANNGVGNSVQQVFTLIINSAYGPAFTSAPSAAFTAGAGGAFPVRASGNPLPILSESGALPAGVSFVPGQNGTGTLVVAAGAPPGSATVSFVATAGSVIAVQSFNFTITAPAPVITSLNTAQFTLTGNTGGVFTVSATGVPVPTLSEVGALPAGVTFTPNANGTATVSVAPGTIAGTYGFTINAVNGVNPAAAQPFLLTVN